MTQLVDHADIEARVGTQRRPAEHWARAASREQQVFILHSAECLAWHEAGRRDLRDCPFSLALDAGIDLNTWTGWEDVPVRVAVQLHARTATTTLVPWPRTVTGASVFHG